MSQGSHACSTTEPACLGGAAIASAVGPDAWPFNAVVVQMVFGRQTLKKRTRHTIDTIAATISTSHGPWKLDTRNCGTAKATPATRIAGQICTMPRHPANAQISQNGTISEKNGNWRPTIAPNLNKSNPVTADKAMIGVPSAP